MGDVQNGDIAINAKTTQAKLMKFSPVIKHKVYLENTKIQDQKHLGWHFPNQNVQFRN